MREEDGALNRNASTDGADHPVEDIAERLGTGARPVGVTASDAACRELETITWLNSPNGRGVLASLRGYDAADALALSGRLRADGLAPHLVAAALTQVRLREAARPRMGGVVDELLFTEDGAQQATRLVVARRHAQRFARTGVRHVADLGCGLGADSLAFLHAGLAVTAVELDPVTAAIAEANLSRAAARSPHPGAGAGHAKVIRGDAMDVAATLGPEVALWADPARRRGGRRIQDPEQWSPPLSAVLALAVFPNATRRALGVKVAPGIDHAVLPSDAEVEFVSVDGALVEAAIWLGSACDEPGRVAVVIRTDPVAADAHDDVRRTGYETGAEGGPYASDGPPTTTALLREDLTAHPEARAADSPVRMAPVRPLGEYLYEPDDAVLRSGLVARAGELLGPEAAAGIVSPGIAYLTGDAWPEPPARGDAGTAEAAADSTDATANTGTVANTGAANSTDATANRAAADPVSPAAPFLTAYRIMEVLPLTVKKLKSRLRALGATSVAIKKRGVNIDPEVLRRDLGFGTKSAKKLGATQTPREVTLIVTPVEGRVRVLLVEPLRHAHLG